MPGRRTGQRELVENASGKHFAKRDEKGKFKEMDNVGRSLAADRRQAAKHESKSGHGDQGDRNRS